MFDLTSSKLFILAVVALIVVGPKDLPALLRTIGRYMGMIRRQANEFRAQFEDAMRETELADLRKEVEDLGRETKSTFDEATRTVETHVGDVNRELTTSMDGLSDTAERKPDAATEALAAPTSNSTPAIAAAEPETIVGTGEDRPAVVAPAPAPVAPPAAQPRPVSSSAAPSSPASAAHSGA